MFTHAFVIAIGLGSPADPQGVVGGEPAPAGPYDAAVRVDRRLFNQFCSGTLIRPDVVLTAAHCFDRIDAPSELEVYFDAEVSGTVDVVEFGVHPDYCGEACELDRFDYGYVRLAEPLEISPVDVLTEQDVWDEAVRLGSTVKVVGWGEVPELGGTSGYERWMVDVPIRGFTAEGIEFVAGGDGKDSCEGDSGGPVFVTASDGSLRVAAVTSRGSEVCGEGGFYGVAYHAMGWLSEQVDDPTLCGEDCGTCDCLDTVPPSEDGCCSTQRPRSTPWVLFALVFLLRRRRAARLCSWSRR